MLEEEYNYNILLRMTSENSEEQLIKEHIPKENLSRPGYNLSRNWLFINRGVVQDLWLLVLFFLINYEQLSIYFFSSFCLLHFYFSNQLSYFLLSRKPFFKKKTQIT